MYNGLTRIQFNNYNGTIFISITLQKHHVIHHVVRGHLARISIPFFKTYTDTHEQISCDSGEYIDNNISK